VPKALEPDELHFKGYIRELQSNKLAVLFLLLTWELHRRGLAVDLITLEEGEDDA